MSNVGSLTTKKNTIRSFDSNDIFMNLNPANAVGKISTTRFPSLDGWRAVSIIMVLGSHCKVVAGFPQSLDRVFYWLFDGDLGVRCFFVISGFLITYLLLQENNQTGSISLQKFYIRRALRILPVYFAFLLVVLLLQIFTLWHQPLIVWIGNLTFTTDFLPVTWTTGHLWSLAVEEQFYLLWPLILVWIGLKGNQRTAFYILGIPLIVAPICRVINHLAYADALPPVFHNLFPWSSFFNYFDSLAVGCLTAILLARNGPQISTVLNRSKWPGILSGLALVFIPYILNRLFPAGIFMAALFPVFQAAGLAILLLQSILTPQLFQPLNWPVVKYLGVLSYSIYIWQMIFCSNPQNFGWSHVWFMSFPGWLLGALLAAVLSYHGLEKPLMRLRARFRKAD
jgi:peptidoglycan/LPS O-acetylase OafA/YrhL